MRGILKRLSVLSVALALVTAACGSGEEKGSLTETAPAGKELNIGATGDFYVREEPRANLGMWSLNANIFETLAYLTPTYEVKPLLAERWEFRAPNTWRFFLRRGIRFHDGQPFNAQAVKEGLFDRRAKVPGGGQLKAAPDSAVVVDEYTIDFTPRVPNLRVPEQVVHPSESVAAPGSDIGKHPIGTGPFRFIEYQQKEKIVVERNPDYWGEKAKVDRITFRFYPDNHTRRLALESDDIDFAYNVNNPDAAPLRARGFKIVTSPVGSYQLMNVNIRGGPPYDLLSDVRLRKAVAHAIDRNKLVDGVLAGLATTDQTVVPPAALGSYRPLVLGLSYDPAEARSLLDEAGWRLGPDGVRDKDGRRLKLVLVSGFPSAELNRPMPVFLQSQLKEVGIQLDVVEVPDSATYSDLLKKKEGDLFLESAGSHDANPAFLPLLSYYTGPGATPLAQQALSGPGGKFDELLAPALTEVDVDKVRKATAEAMHELIDEQAAVISLAGIFQIYGMTEALQGFVPHPSFMSLRWNEVELAR